MRLFGNVAPLAPEAAPDSVAGAPDPAATEPCLRFIFWRHTNDHVAEVMPHLADIDIIAWEGFNAQRDKRQVDRAFNVLSHGVAGDLSAVQDRLFELNLKNAYFTIAKQLKGSGKQFRNIDASDDDDELATASRRYDQQQASLKADLSGFCPPSKAVAGALAMSQAMAELAVGRDKVMAENIAQLRAEEPDSRIAVVVGAGHNQLARAVQTGGSVERVYTRIRPYMRAKMEYDAHECLPRYLMFGKEPPVTLIHKTLLQGLIELVVHKQYGDKAFHGVNSFSPQETARFIDQLERAARRIGKDPKAEFRYKNAVIQAAKLAVRKLTP